MIPYLKHLVWSLLFDEAAAKPRLVVTLAFLGGVFKSGGVVSVVPGMPDLVIPGLAHPAFQQIGTYCLLGAAYLAAGSTQAWRDAAAARQAATKNAPPSGPPPP